MSQSHSNPLAIVLFCIYLLLYGGFIAINLFAPEVMAIKPIAGVNLAIWYGFGLIFAAIFLAAIYGLSGSKKDEIANLIAENDQPGEAAGSKEVSS